MRLKKRVEELELDLAYLEVTRLNLVRSMDTTDELVAAMVKRLEKLEKRVGKMERAR